MKSQALGRRYKAIPFATLVPAIGFALVLLIYWIQQPLILSDFGIVSLCNQSVALSLAAMAQTLVVITGGIDLSVGSLISLSTCFAATYMGTSEGAAVPVLCATLLLGVLTGALNGALVVFGRLEPLIATLGTSFIFGGIALQIRPQPGGSVPPWFATMLTGNLSFLPYSLVLLLVTVCLIWVPLRKSRIGRGIQAVGNNEHSAYISGLNPKKAKLFAYATAGLLTAVAGLFITAQTTSGDPNVGDVYTLNSIAAVVLGGVSLRGGRGRIAGPILSGFLLSTIVSALLAGFVNPQFLSWDSLRIQLTLAAFIGIAGIGQTLAILIGQIDLSIPANISLSAILSANVYGQTSNPILSLIAGCAVGGIAGLLNGIGIAWLRVHSLIWSLGMNLVLQGTTLVYTDTAAPSSTIAPFARWIVTGTVVGVPIILAFWILLSAACLVVLDSTAFGRRIYALGNNELATAMSGINVFQVYLPVYLISGLTASITGILLSGYSGQTYLGMGDSYLLIPIAAVVIGGTTLAGGRGGYFGTMIGSVAVVLLDSVLTSLQVSPGLRKIFFGTIIVAMMLLFRRKRGLE